MKKIACLLFTAAFLFPFCLKAQQKPAKVTVTLSEHETLAVGDKVNLLIRVVPEKGWHVYSALPSEEGVYQAALISYEITSVGFEAGDKIKEEGGMITEFDDIMEGTMRYYKTAVTFSHPLKITEEEVQITGAFDYMACDDEKCLVFTEEFNIKP
jgi:DsbC/DsbD-like thiol-disulfide interchange protein